MVTLKQDHVGVFSYDDMDEIQDGEGSVVNALADVLNAFNDFSALNVREGIILVQQVQCNVVERNNDGVKPVSGGGTFGSQEKVIQDLLEVDVGKDRRQDVNERRIFVPAGRRPKHEFHRLFGVQEDAMVLQVVLEVFVVGFPLISSDARYVAESLSCTGNCGTSIARHERESVGVARSSCRITR